MENCDYFSKKFYKKCLEVEVFKGKKHTFLKRFWLKYFNPETNSVFLIRKYIYKLHSSSRGLAHRFIRVKLMKKYNIHVSSNTRIGLGLSIRHPSNIMITNAKIGDNCVLFHNVTIGAKYEEADMDNSPVIGNDVKFFSNSACYGKVVIADGVSIGSFSCVINDILVPGVYVGIGKQIRKIK